MKRILSVALLVFVLDAVHSQEWVVKWAKAITSESLLVNGGLARDDSGNIYRGVEFTNEMTFDPPAAMFTATSNATHRRDLAIVKTDDRGSIIWVKTLGSTNSDDIVNMAINEEDELLIFGFYRGTIDFDPGVGDSSITSTQEDMFLLKLDLDGNFISVNIIGGDNINRAHFMALDPNDGSILLSGNFDAATDFDFGPSTFSPSSSEGCFLAKYTSDLDLLWIREVVTLNGSQPTVSTMIVDSQSRINVNLEFYGTTQYDSLAADTVRSRGRQDLLLLQYEQDGNINWYHHFGDDEIDFYGQIKVDASDNIYTAGTTAGDQIDLNPDSMAGSDTLFISGTQDGFLQKFDQDGNFQWVYQVRTIGSSSLAFSGILHVEGDSVYLGGGFAGTIDVDPTGSNQNVSSNTGGDRASFIINMSTDREVGWFELYGGDGNQQNMSNIISDGDGGLIVTGGYSGTSGSFGGFTLPADNSATELVLFSRANCVDNITIDSTSCVGTDFDGVTLRTSGQYLGEFTNQFGCDSLVTFNFTFTGDTHEQEVISVETYDFGTQNLFADGTYTEIFTNTNGCDSAVTIDFFRAEQWKDGFWQNGGQVDLEKIVIISGDLVTGNDIMGIAIRARRLIIDPGATLEVSPSASVRVVGEIENNGTLIVRSGGVFVLSDSLVFSGNEVTVKRNTTYADGRYSFVGSPVQQSSANIGDNLGTAVYKYDETIPYSTNDGLDRWVAAGSEELIPGRGYTQANQEEIVFTGIPNIGEVTYSGTYTSDDGINEGFNLVSNPYTHAITLSDFLLGNPNVEGVIYFWDDNGSDTGRGTNSDYIVANEIGATNTTPAGGQDRFNGRIGTAQGFFVKLKDNTDTDIDFSQEMGGVIFNRDGEFFRTTETPLVRINLTHVDGLFKQTVLAWREDGSSNELIRAYDAPIFNPDAEDLIYSVKANEEMAIQVQPYQWDEVPLGVNVSIPGTYQLSMEGDEPVYLIDHKTGEITDLVQDSYSFSTEAGQFKDRFSLVSSPTTVLGAESEGIHVYGYEGYIYVLQPDERERTYRVFDLNGQLVIQENISGNDRIETTGLIGGIYLVNDGEETYKVLIE